MTEKKPATKKKTARKKKKTRANTVILDKPQYVDVDKALDTLENYSAGQLDRDVFTFIAGWVYPDGRTYPTSPALKTIANGVGTTTGSVSKAVHRLKEFGLLRIDRDYTQEDEHPRNIYTIPRRYLLDETSNAAQSIGALSAIVGSEDMSSESGDSSRSADILCKLADLLNDYQKKQNIITAGIREAEDDAVRFREGQDYLAAVTLHRVTGFLNDALKQ